MKINKLSIGENIRVYLDEIEEWKCYRVEEVLEKTEKGYRYLLRDKNGYSLIRVVDYNNENKIFKANKIQSDEKKLEVDWIIHYVPYNEDTVSIHTHGIDKYIGKELELKLPVSTELGQDVINAIACEIVFGRLDIFNGVEVEKGILSCPFRIMNTREFGNEKGEELFRIILPDNKFRFPDNEECEEIFKKQID